MSGFTWPKPLTGPRELNPAISPMNSVLKNGCMRIGNSEIAPFAGLSLSVEEIALIRICASAGETFAEGIVPLTAVGFCVAAEKITPTAPEAAAMFETYANGVCGNPERFTSAMRPLTADGHGPVGLST